MARQAALRTRFGIGRCLFASNVPVAGLRVDYDTLMRSVRRMLDDFGDADRHRSFVGNAAAFYRLDLGAAARSG
jgi:predicted TIM-barrel fold metal-dependent hydrolase